MWLARDKDGMLYLYTEEPYKSKNAYYMAIDKCRSVALDRNCFPEVTFENSPVEVELKIKEESK